MGMSTNIIGFRAPDEKWKAMKAIYDSCKAAGVGVPSEVELFFENGKPDERGVEIKIEVAEWVNEYSSGYEVDLKKLPANLTHIRFYNSY